jgi:hypothetical protein
MHRIGLGPEYFSLHAFESAALKDKFDGANCLDIGRQDIDTCGLSRRPGKNCIGLIGPGFLRQGILCRTARGSDQTGAELCAFSRSLPVAFISVSAFGAEQLTIAARRR